MKPLRKMDAITKIILRYLNKNMYKPFMDSSA